MMEKEWIKVEDGKPEHAVSVLGCNKAGKMFTVWYDASADKFMDRLSTFDSKHSYPITHWMKLPEPPKN